ncbi:MAG: phosphotransferase [Coxiellaceae bacterium]|nr:phosphotransferase [Coxiellaceae bacterium]
MRHNTYRRIEQAFNSLGITLAQPIAEATDTAMAESVTNTFVTVSDTSDTEYLVRFNGKLWPPFTRTNEHDNLVELNRKGFFTNVLFNDPKHGFQLCQQVDSNACFASMLKSQLDSSAITAIGQQIRSLHAHAKLKGDFTLHKTVENSLWPYEQATTAKAQLIKEFYPSISALMLVLHRQTEYRVSSHNDLLPSSIYHSEDEPTFVDWEYAGNNHRSYDLALFAVKSKLDHKQQRALLEAYDPGNLYDTEYTFHLMKPVVNFLLMLWNKETTDTSIEQGRLLLQATMLSLFQVTAIQSARCLITETRLGLFKPASPVETTAHKAGDDLAMVL